MTRGPDAVHRVTVAGLAPGARYGFRADGPYRPQEGLWFDPAKLLVDPNAVALDRRFAYDPRLGAPREQAIDTAPLMPKSVVAALPEPTTPPAPLFRPGGFIYEAPVRAFTLRHPEVPERLRGTVAALAHPAILEHLTRLGVDAVELMPVTAWIDERHLPPLGLANAWGYNPVAFLALDPRLCPGGIAELRETVAALRGAGIGVILDVVFNHTGESDAQGPTLSLRGLGARAYFRHDAEGLLVNDTGCGNTLDCAHPATRRLVLDALRHFVGQAGIDGFRFDLAPILGRMARGFDPEAPLLREITADPWLSDRVLIAEPWDVGLGGYCLGRFPAPWLEWNDRFRDRVRRFWRGDSHAIGDLATALAGSADVFAAPSTRSVNFVAAHDGFALRDVVSYTTKHNQANGEMNRDGHDDNLSWNNGAEGATADRGIDLARSRDARALIGTLFASRGTVMLTAGDEFGRGQGGNNNAYAQDNVTTWLDWTGRDRDLESFCARVSALRRSRAVLRDQSRLTGAADAGVWPDVEWRACGGGRMTEADWHDPRTGRVAMILADAAGRMGVLVNRTGEDCRFALPARPGFAWTGAENGCFRVEARSVAFASEEAAAAAGAAPLEARSTKP